MDSTQEAARLEFFEHIGFADLRGERFNRSKFFASVYSRGLPSLRATRSSLWRCSSLMPHREGHGHDAAAYGGPEAVEELFVVAQENDHLVAALRAHALQVVQDAESPV